MKLRILVCDSLAPAGIKRLQTCAEVIETGDLSQLGSVDALIVRSHTQLTSALIRQAAPRLRVIGRAGVGTNNIDLQAAKASDVIVVNAPRGASIAVAEHTIGLMLALSRQIPHADACLRQGRWQKQALMGVELHGKTLGIVGIGRIGTQVAQRAKAMGMHVLGYSPPLTSQEIAALGVEASTLETLLRSSDYVSLHVPLTESTRGMIDTTALSLMKASAYLVCTARGGIIVEDALFAALEGGCLAGAALDTFSQEPPGLTALIEHPHVISTPHIGAQTVEAQERVGIDIASEVIAALNGKPLRWRVA